MSGVVERLARTAALAGGLVLTLLVALTGVSVLGRGLNTLGHSGLLPDGLAEALIATGVGPITGDFELVEAGISFAIFAFLPICQLYGAHATVDVFASVFPRLLNRILPVFWEVVLSAMILLITWRLGAGMMNKVSNGETTFLLQFPIWWAYAASFGAAVVASIVAIYCAGARVWSLRTGETYLPRPGGSSH